jgi:DUF971 family protein
MPLPIDTRKKPTDVKVYVSSGEGVAITWSDGHVSRYTFPYLRDNCPCATCNDEGAKKGSDNSSAKSPDLLPMYKPRVTAKAAKAIGNYAIGIEFSDAHATGIYSFDCLREICPCDACAQEFRPSERTTTA